MPCARSSRNVKNSLTVQGALGVKKHHNISMHIIHLLKQIECVSSRQSKTNTAEKNVGNMFHFVNEVWDFNSGFSMKKNAPAGSSWRLPVLLAFEK